MRRNKDPMYRAVMNDSRWKKARSMVLSRDKICQDCIARGIVTPIAEVHHIVPLESIKSVSEFYRMAFDLHNLIGLCKDCHHLRHQTLGSHTKAEKKRRREEELQQFIIDFL